MIELTCIYKAEHYSVKNDGSVLRHPCAGKKPRPLDNQWTFGKINLNTGYPEIASVPIHRIVATAFHGDAPTSQHVVDHKDTNKCNNRPENLRWVTKFENIMLNPITVKRIEWVIGDKIEKFLENPAKYKDKFQDPNLAWMRTVTAISWSQYITFLVVAKILYYLFVWIVIFKSKLSLLPELSNVRGISMYAEDTPDEMLTNAQFIMAEWLSQFSSIPMKRVIIYSSNRVKKKDQLKNISFRETIQFIINDSQSNTPSI